ncbi:MAG: TolC family protein, partial [Betaproteobacteria bacterium]|nr:TolC family protein [Betaproteobacteria bacterium]
YFPAISLTGNVGGESAQLSDLFTGPARIWRFAGELTQPLWGAGRLQAQKGIAEARNEQALQSYRATVVNAFREVADALSAHTQAAQVVAVKTQQVSTLTQTWELAKLRFAKGLANQLEVIDIERSLLQAELSRITAERDLRLAVADFYSALGGRAG